MTDEHGSQLDEPTPEAPEAASGVGRRGFLGYVGTALAGAAVGVGAGVAGAAAVRDEQQAPDGSTGTGDATPAATGRTISAHGPHQPGVASHPPAVAEVVALDLRADLLGAHDRGDLGRLLRIWTGDVEALTAGRGAPGDSAPWLSSAGADLTVTVGLGPRMLGEAWGIAEPEGFGTVPAMRHDRLRTEWSGGDLLLLVAGRDGTTVGHAVRRLVADAGPFATLRWRQQGNWNGVDAQGQAITGRNLFGQVDGSGNPPVGSDLFETTVWIDQGPWAGGTTMVLRRIRMDLPTWDELTRDEQERAVGRRLSDGAPLTGEVETDELDLTARSEGRYVIAAKAHARRSHHSTNGGARIFRKGANYELPGPDGAETGLLFMSFQANLTTQFVPVQRSVDELDALNEWTTAIGSAEFAILPGFEEGQWLGQALVEG